MRSSYYKDFVTSRIFDVEIRFRDDPFFVDVVLSLTIVEPYRIRTFSAHRSYYSGVISICFRAVIKSNVSQENVNLIAHAKGVHRLGGHQRQHEEGCLTSKIETKLVQLHQMIG